MNSQKSPDREMHTGASSRLWGLEALRFSSALAILLTHYPGHYLLPFPELAGRLVELPSWLAILLQPFRFGPWAVQVFWILSGYIFYHQYACRVAQGIVSWRQFFIHRVSRLYPLHLVTLLSVVACQQLYALKNLSGPFENNSLSNFILQLGFASNWWVFEKSFNQPIWSVSVEVLVYGLFFIVVRRCAKSIWPPLVLLVPSLLLSQQKALEGGVIECMVFFFSGGLAWLLEEKLRPRNSLGMAMGLAVVVMVSWAAGWMHAPKTLLLLGVTSGIVCLGHLPAWRGLAKICNFLGHLTYGSYLLHFPVSLLVVWAFRQFGFNPELFLMPGTFLLVLMGIFYLAWLSYRHLEEPCQSWIRHQCLGRVGPAK